jgi:hypothetical protein
MCLQSACSALNMLYNQRLPFPHNTSLLLLYDVSYLGKAYPTSLLVRQNSSLFSLLCFSMSAAFAHTQNASYDACVAQLQRCSA